MCASITSNLHYCNSLYHGLLNIYWLWRGFEFGSFRTHVTSILIELHFRFLPVRYRIIEFDVDCIVDSVNEWILGRVSAGIPRRFCRAGWHHYQLSKGERAWDWDHRMHSGWLLLVFKIIPLVYSYLDDMAPAYLRDAIELRKIFTSVSDLHPWSTCKNKDRA